MINPAILILAAGQSRRMLGRNKLLEMVDGAPLIATLAARACATGLPVFVVSALPDSTALLVGEPVTILKIDSTAPPEMSASLRQGIKALPDTISHVLILLSDMPEITTNDLASMIEAIHKTPNTILRGATALGLAGHPVVFSRKYFAAIQALTGDNGANRVIKQHKVRLIPLPENHAITDLDSPADWERWRKNNPDR